MSALRIADAPCAESGLAGVPRSDVAPSSTPAAQRADGADGSGVPWQGDCREAWLHNSLWSGVQPGLWDEVVVVGAPRAAALRPC